MARRTHTRQDETTFPFCIYASPRIGPVGCGAGKTATFATPVLFTFGDSITVLMVLVEKRGREKHSPNCGAHAQIASVALQGYYCPGVQMILSIWLVCTAPGSSKEGGTRLCSRARCCCCIANGVESREERAQVSVVAGNSPGASRGCPGRAPGRAPGRPGIRAPGRG